MHMRVWVWVWVSVGYGYGSIWGGRVSYPYSPVLLLLGFKRTLPTLSTWAYSLYCGLLLLSEIYEGEFVVLQTV